MVINGCDRPIKVNASSVTAACHDLKSSSYFPIVKRFLRFLFLEGHIDRDYANVVPVYKCPRQFPSVYSEEEVKRFEDAVLTKQSKRNYAIILFATRLAIRSGDISKLCFNDVDFDVNEIHIVQQKTETILELPLLPKVKLALQDYINNERPAVDSHYIFLVKEPPYNHISYQVVGNIVAQGLKEAKIDTGSRHRGAHAFRSSLASSMVNDNIPYEVVRKTLGHVDPNAIKSYARLDIEQLRVYSLAAPEATSDFAEFLAERRML